MHIGHVEKLPLTTGGSPLLVRCKNFLCATFVIGKERECQDVYQSLLKLSRPGLPASLLLMGAVVCVCRGVSLISRVVLEFL